MIRIFISHRHSDEAIAKKLVDYLFAALTVKEGDIRCTSVVGHKLTPGTHIESQLKQDINGDIALIGLLTKNSLHSQWVLFELGAAWGKGKRVIPILGPGVKHEDLPGPLKSCIPVSIEDKEVKFSLNSMIQKLADELNGIEREFGNRAEMTRDDFIEELKAWKSQLPAPEPSQQKEIEQLEKERSLVEQLEAQERSHKEQLEELQALSQQEKEELERNYQKQKEELEQSIQSLQSAIKQLEQELAQERSHNQQLEEMKAASQQEKEELERNYQNQKQRLERSLQSQIKQTASQAQNFTVTEDLGNGIKLEMIAIPGGKFMMGSPEGEGEDREKPQHEVTVQPFLMGKYLITQAQWKAIASLPKIERDLEPDPSRFKGDERPVERVSWIDAVEFCQRLSKQTGKEYRLPSEAEWEYACRAGTITTFNFGETITDKLANYDKNVGETTFVGQFPPNAFGLYDMHGNVYELCADPWHKNYQGAPEDSRVWNNEYYQDLPDDLRELLKNENLLEDDNGCIFRGGSWYYVPWSCRSAYRLRGDPDLTNDSDDVGFRVVCVAPRTT